MRTIVQSSTLLKQLQDLTKQFTGLTEQEWTTQAQNSFARARKWSANYIVALICIGFFLGGLVGARIATALSNAALEKVFGVTLLLIALKMIFAK